MGTQQVQYGFLQAPRRPLNYQKGLEEEIRRLSQGKVKDVVANKNNEPSLDLKLESDITSEYFQTENRPVDAIRGRLYVAMQHASDVEINVFINCADSLMTATPRDSILQLDSEFE